MTFRVGDIVRHKNPYWGEPAYYICRIKDDGVRGNPTGSKHGTAWERGGSAQIISHASVDKYKICPLYMRVWLCILGHLAELRKY